MHLTNCLIFNFLQRLQFDLHVTVVRSAFFQDRVLVEALVVLSIQLSYIMLCCTRSLFVLLDLPIVLLVHLLLRIELLLAFAGERHC